MLSPFRGPPCLLYSEYRLYFSAAKRPGCEIDLLSSLVPTYKSAELPPASSVCLNGVHRANLCLYRSAVPDFQDCFATTYVDIRTVSFSHNCLNILISICYMFRLLYRAIIRRKGTKEKLTGKIPYVSKNINTVTQRSGSLSVISGSLSVISGSLSEIRGSLSVISGSLSPRHGASSGCGWRNGLQIWRVAANILNKQSQTADKGWPSSLGVGRDSNNSLP